MTEDPDDGVQFASSISMPKESSQQPHKMKRVRKCSQTSEAKEEEEDENDDDDDDDDGVEVTSEEYIPPLPPTEGLFSPVFLKGADDVILANFNAHGNKLVAKSLLNGIILKGDMERYKKVPMEKLRSRQEQLLYDVTFATLSRLYFDHLFFI